MQMFIKTIALLLALLFLPDIYIYFMYIVKWVKSGLWRCLFFLPTILLIIYMFTIRIGTAAAPDHQHAVGVFFIIFLCICVPKAMFFIIDGIGHLFHVQLLERVFRIMAMAASGTAVLILITGYCWGKNHFVVHQQTFVFDNLPPAFDGYRIAFFSDLHIGTFRQGNEKDVQTIADLINAQEADAIMFGGDLVNYQCAEVYGFEQQLSSLKAKDGVFSIMGNHDYSSYIRYASEEEKQADIKKLEAKQREFGWTLLLNEHSIIRRGNDSIAVVGVENDGKPPFPSLGDLPKATKGIADGTFCILLTHDPTHWRRKVIPETNISLSLAGHTHAGQFKVFGWSPVKYVYDEWSGAYTEGDQMLDVSDGVGAVMFPFRFGAWPEVNAITLRRKAP